MDVGFPVKRLPGKYKCCDACFNCGEVTQIELPETRYWNHRDLSTEYRKYWLCDNCKQKLISALKDGERNE